MKPQIWPWIRRILSRKKVFVHLSTSIKSLSDKIPWRIKRGLETALHKLSFVTNPVFHSKKWIGFLCPQSILLDWDFFTNPSRLNFALSLLYLLPLLLISLPIQIFSGLVTRSRWSVRRLLRFCIFYGLVLFLVLSCSHEDYQSIVKNGLWVSASGSARA